MRSSLPTGRPNVLTCVDRPLSRVTLDSNA